MATALISKFHRQLVLSPATRRHVLGAGSFGVVKIETVAGTSQLRKYSSDSNICSASENFQQIQQQQKRSYRKR